eukprot:scaffold14576_cov158-Skeletonema_dohrnii-CCMP3373.AAC.1
MGVATRLPPKYATGGLKTYFASARCHTACQSNEQRVSRIQRVMSNEKRGTYASDTSPTRK